MFQSNSVTIPGFLFTANDADDDLAHNVGEQLSVDLAAGSINGSHTFGTVAVDNGNVVYTAPDNFTPPAPDQTLTDQFGYLVKDQAGVTSGVMVTLMLEGGGQLHGTGGDDVLIASPAVSTLTGNGGSDSFYFAPHFGQDKITDFAVGIDSIMIDHSIFADVTALLAATHDDAHGDAVVVAAAGVDTITFQGVTKAQLQASDFHFV